MCALQAINPYNFSYANQYGEKFDQAYRIAFRAEEKYNQAKNSNFSTAEEVKKYKNEFKQSYSKAEDLLKKARFEELNISTEANKNLTSPKKLDYYA
ncbi:hypothetical protein IKB17_02630 [bacterium]|nr:hypothetical protein [bacterium]